MIHYQINFVYTYFLFQQVHFQLNKFIAINFKFLILRLIHLMSYFEFTFINLKSYFQNNLFIVNRTIHCTDSIPLKLIFNFSANLNSVNAVFPFIIFHLSNNPALFKSNYYNFKCPIYVILL